MGNNLIVNTNQTIDGKRSIGQFFNDIGTALMDQKSSVVVQTNQKQQTPQAQVMQQQQKQFTPQLQAPPSHVLAQQVQSIQLPAPIQPQQQNGNAPQLQQALINSKSKNETSQEPATNSTLKTGSAAKNDVAHAKDETGQNISVKVNKTEEEIHSDHKDGQHAMEEYLKKNPSKNKTKNATKNITATGTTPKEGVSKDAIKEQMESKIKESIEKKKQCEDHPHDSSLEKHYKEYTHQPESHQQPGQAPFSKEDFDKVSSILSGMKSKNLQIKKQQQQNSHEDASTHEVGSPTKKAEIHAKIIDEALKANDYFVDHPTVKKEVSSVTAKSGSGLDHLVDEIAGECEKLDKAVKGAVPTPQSAEPIPTPQAIEPAPTPQAIEPAPIQQEQPIPTVQETPLPIVQPTPTVQETPVPTVQEQEPSPAPTTPYIPPDTESPTTSIPEPSNPIASSVPESTPVETPAPVEIPAPIVPEPETQSDLASQLESFDSQKLAVDSQQALASKAIQSTVQMHKTEQNQLTKLMDEISDEPSPQAMPTQSAIQTEIEDMQTQQTDESALIPELQDHTNIETDDAINMLANKIKFHDSNTIASLTENLIQTDESSNSHGPEEDNLLQLGNQASSQVSSQAAMQAKIAALLQSRVQAKTQAKTKAQSKVKAQDANLIAMLQKQIATMEAKKNPAVNAAAAKKKAVHNIQKSLTAKILNRLDDNQPLVNVFSKMQSLSKMMPAVQDMERRLGILHQVEPIIEKAVKTLESVIDLKNSPLQPPAAAPAPKPAAPETDLSLDSLTEVAAAPATGGLDMSALTALLGGQAAAPAAEPEPEAGGLDLSALLGGMGGAATAAPEAEEDSGAGGERDMLAKLLGGL